MGYFGDTILQVFVVLCVIGLLCLTATVFVCLCVEMFMHLYKYAAAFSCLPEL